jgi:hypothetical protein
MNYPITFTFKILAFGTSIFVRDAGGNLLGYVKKKKFKLKEDINVFADENQTQLLFNIKADRVIDFSAKYNFTDSTGRFLGSVKRQGMRSIWKSHYQIQDANDQMIMEVHEENAWVKVIDAVIGELPVIGMFTGYLFNPAYIVTRTDNTPVARLQKQPAFFEGKFEVTTQSQLSQSEESIVLLGLLTMTLLERGRG